MNSLGKFVKNIGRGNQNIGEQRVAITAESIGVYKHRQLVRARTRAAPSTSTAMNELVSMYVYICMYVYIYIYISP